MVGRFAPSPSGRIHLGNILCCLLAWLSARQQGGRVVLRIEDLDTARCPRRYADQMEADLRWLGLDWDQGPGVGGPDGPYYQSQRTELYQEALETLAAQGLVYPCFCTRAELHAASAPHREDGQVIYAGTCRRLTAEQAAARARETGRAPALRLRVPAETWSVVDGHMGPYGENLAEACGDFLLRRSDGMFAYQLAVVVDDAAMGVTEVVRGADLLTSTPRQLLLYHLLGLPAPRFFHVPLLLAPDGRRLSKRDADAGLDVLRDRCTAAEILGRLAYLAGFNPAAAPKTALQLLDDFSWDKVPAYRRDCLDPRNKKTPQADACGVFGSIGETGLGDVHLRHQLPADDGEHLLQLGAVLLGKAPGGPVQDLPHVGGGDIVVVDVLLRDLQMILPPVLRGLMLSDVSLFHQTVDLIGGVGRRDLHKGGKFIHRGTAKGHNGLHAEGLHSGETGLPVLKAAKDLLIKMSTSGISSRPTMESISSSLAQSSLEKRRVARSRTSRM